MVPQAHKITIVSYALKKQLFKSCYQVQYIPTSNSSQAPSHGSSTHEASSILSTLDHTWSESHSKGVRSSLSLTRPKRYS